MVKEKAACNINRHCDKASYHLVIKQLFNDPTTFLQGDKPIEAMNFLNKLNPDKED